MTLWSDPRRPPGSEEPEARRRWRPARVARYPRRAPASIVQKAQEELARFNRRTP